MKTLDATGASLNALLFIQGFEEAKKLAPARFMTLRLHPNRWNDIMRYAIVPKSIQVGEIPLPMGRRATKVNVITPPQGVSDGMVVVEDTEMDPTRLDFLIHGVLEFSVINIGQ